MPNKSSSHTQYTKQEIIDHCKRWLAIHKNDDMPTLLNDRLAAIIETDILTYPIETQDWLTKNSNPELWSIIETANAVDSNHSDKHAWDGLVHSIKVAIQIHEHKPE